MRPPVLLVLSALAALAVAPAAAYHEPRDDDWGTMCPAYTREVDLKVDEDPYATRSRAQTSDSRALLLTTTYQDEHPSTFYVAVDWLLVNEPGTPVGGFSIWYYEETNGLEGLQRADEVCDNTPEKMVPDTLIS